MADSPTPDELPMGALNVTVYRKEPCTCADSEYPGCCQGDNCDPGHHDCAGCGGDAWVWREVTDRVFVDPIERADSQLVEIVERVGEQLTDEAFAALEPEETPDADRA